MQELRICKTVQVLFYCWWTTSSVFCQGLINDQNSGTTEEHFGYSYFFYQKPGYPRECKEARSLCPSANISGVHLIKPDGYPEPFEVYCDNTVDSGGWTVIHRIQDGYIHFNRSWADYRNGFGFLSQEFWIGNDKLSFLTNQNSNELRIEFTASDGQSLDITYDKFRISDEYSGYKMTSVGEYSGNEDKINKYLCHPTNKSVVYISPNCSRRCSCNSGEFTCDDDYRCSPNAVCEERNNVLQCYCNEGYSGDGVSCALPDCQDVYDRVSNESGIYKIKPTTWQGDPFDVYCNMTDGGGWTVFQRRVNGSQDFFLYWSDYKEGFGTPDHELWLGNDKLHSLTTQKNYELRVDVVDSVGDPYYAKHSSFRISDESDNYRLSLGNYSEGDAGNRLSRNNGKAFSTRDHDNDMFSGVNCATRFTGCYCGSHCNINGAWWFASGNPCSYVHINGPYGTDGFRWNGLPGRYDCNITYTEMKVRPTGSLR